MVYRILSIIASALLGIATLLGIVSLVYTLGSSAVQAGFSQLGTSFQDGVSSITEAIDDLVEASAVLASATTSSSAGESDSAAGSGSGISLSSVTSLLSLGSGGNTTAESFADSELGAAYQTWKDLIDSPVERVFSGTSIDADAIEGISGGSTAALELLSGLDDATLTTVSTNATNLRLTASANTPSSSLPATVRAYMSSANQSCMDFCDAVLEMVEYVRDFNSGNLLALTSLYSAASNATAALEAMDDAMVAAEAELGA